MKIWVVPDRSLKCPFVHFYVFDTNVDFTHRNISKRNLDTGELESTLHAMNVGIFRFVRGEKLAEAINFRVDGAGRPIQL